MALVDLGDGIFVNPEHVVSVRRSFHDTLVIVRDMLGDTHEVQRRYGESIWDAERRVSKTINDAATKGGSA